MSMLDRVNELFHELLSRFAGGIANTSNVKYDEIKSAVAANLSLGDDDVYATGATTRISNLDTRLAQGNQRGQHAPLALVFLKLASKDGEDAEEALARFRKSFSATCSKFVTGEERGTTFDGILAFVQLDAEQDLRLLRFIYAAGCSYAPALLSLFPSIDEVELVRHASAAPPAPPAGASTSATASAAVAPKLDSLLGACEADLTQAGLKLSPGLLGRYIASLLTKRFVILAGLSGSGKTKVALAVAKWMEEVEGQVELVAIGADWTNNESVLGYRDALDQDKYRAPTSGALDLILRASRDQDRPYFLILDEMNLSHVERYFADLLSAIESGQPIALHSADGEVDGVPSRLLLPPNLFIVGTVNVDETTYTFSPKVLDRANVIEFRVTLDDMRSFLTKPSAIDLSSIAGKGTTYGPLFTSAASRPVSFDDLQNAPGATVKAEVERRLGELFAMLQPIGAEFGYRSALEICRFVVLHALLSGATWTIDSSVDAQVIQKLLPKLHGSERRLRPVLQQLEGYAGGNGLAMSQEKLLRMLDRLREGFTSFLD